MQSDFKHIGEFKNKWVGKNAKALVIGTGPSADLLEKQRAFLSYQVVVGINRAIVYYDKFDFVFVDSVATLRVIQPYLDRTRFVCLPVLSVGKLNINEPLVQDIAAKVVLYTWVFGEIGILKANDYSLNDFLLFVSWGNLQSILHFLSLQGIKTVDSFGCGGKSGLDGNVYAKKVREVFRFENNLVRGINRRVKQHRITAERTLEVAKVLGINYTVY